MEGNQIFSEYNPFYADVAIVVLYFIIWTIYILYFPLGLTSAASKVAPIAQFLLFAGGIASFQVGDTRFFFGSRATVMNIVILILLSLFISIISLVFILKRNRHT
jgi:hypothetical protein